MVILFIFSSSVSLTHSLHIPCVIPSVWLPCWLHWHEHEKCQATFPCHTKKTLKLRTTVDLPRADVHPANQEPSNHKGHQVDHQRPILTPIQSAILKKNPVNSPCLFRVGKENQHFTNNTDIMPATCKKKTAAAKGHGKLPTQPEQTEEELKIVTLKRELQLARATSEAKSIANKPKKNLMPEEKRWIVMVANAVKKHIWKAVKF